ncbi:MAG TPA: NAD(P)H-dependent glycerol-3-phosphate dehydrogenase [Verrucomicrobiae bacterium]|nr:NAD(P)H-dependent glycerol-3-phosphate dehydrogenase [Verrucomicrobiae bacterium]
MKTLTIIGGGSWGTALAVVLSRRFDSVRLWVYEADLAARMVETRQNDLYLPDILLPGNVHICNELSAAVDDASTLLSVVPSHLARSVYQQLLPFVNPSMAFVTATKGLENGSLLRISEVIRDVLRKAFEPSIAVLSGPSFAREVARGDPTAIVVASEDPALAAEVQSSFSGPTFRLYTSTDSTGVEIGGSVKNVIAIGAGVVTGLGLGHNVTAALITRGLAEITRLACAMGGRPQTMAGLAGLGDLVLTCTGDLSRNRMVGVELARGRKLDEIVNSMKMVAEGIKTTSAAVELARKFSVEMPITEQMFQMLHFGISPREAIQRLMERSLKGE